MAGETLVIPLEHFVGEATGATQLIKEGGATNQTTTLYTVPSSKKAYLTSILLTIKSTSLDYELVKIAFTDDSGAVTYDWNVDVSPYATFSINVPFKLGVLMAEDDTLAIISPDAKVVVNATAVLLEYAT
jgi:hypothetical protein